jgi:hypothetical protein
VEPVTDYSDIALPYDSNDFTLKLGSLIGFGYNTDTLLHLDTYPINPGFDRSLLNHKICEHYALREIGYETAEQFVFALGRKMNELMPYYNQLYKSAAVDYDMLSNYDLASSSSNTGTSESSAKAQSNGTQSATVDANSSSKQRSRQVDSQTPDAVLSNTGNYASSVSDVDSTTDSTSHSQTDSSSADMQSQDFTHSAQTGAGNSTTKGRSGVSGAAMISEYRAAILNIDMMIINDLGELFMSVADSGDSMSPYGRSWPVLW